MMLIGQNLQPWPWLPAATCSWLKLSCDKISYRIPTLLSSQRALIHIMRVPQTYYPAWFTACSKDLPSNHFNFIHLAFSIQRLLLSTIELSSHPLCTCIFTSILSLFSQYYPTCLLSVPPIYHPIHTSPLTYFLASIFTTLPLTFNTSLLHRQICSLPQFLLISNLDCLISINMCDTCSNWKYNNEQPSDSSLTLYEFLPLILYYEWLSYYSPHTLIPPTQLWAVRIVQPSLRKRSRSVTTG